MGGREGGEGGLSWPNVLRALVGCAIIPPSFPPSISPPAVTVARVSSSGGSLLRKLEAPIPSPASTPFVRFWGGILWLYCPWKVRKEGGTEGGQGGKDGGRERVRIW